MEDLYEELILVNLRVPYTTQPFFILLAARDAT